MITVNYISETFRKHGVKWMPRAVSGNELAFFERESTTKIPAETLALLVPLLGNLEWKEIYGFPSHPDYGYGMIEFAPVKLLSDYYLSLIKTPEYFNVFYTDGEVSIGAFNKHWLPFARSNQDWYFIDYAQSGKEFGQILYIDFVEQKATVVSDSLSDFVEFGLRNIVSDITGIVDNVNACAVPKSTNREQLGYDNIIAEARRLKFDDGRCFEFGERIGQSQIRALEKALKSNIPDDLSKFILALAESFRICKMRLDGELYPLNIDLHQSVAIWDLEIKDGLKSHTHKIDVDITMDLSEMFFITIGGLSGSQLPKYGGKGVRFIYCFSKNPKSPINGSIFRMTAPLKKIFVTYLTKIANSLDEFLEMREPPQSA